MKGKKILILLLIGMLLGICSVNLTVNAEEETEEYAISEQAEAASPLLNSVTVCRDSGLKLEWQASDDAAAVLENVKYMVLRSSDDGKSFQGLVNREAKYGLFFIDATGLEPGKTYYYKVREYIDGVQQQDSNVVSATAEETAAAENEFSDKETASQYLKEHMIERENEIQIIYNASSFPSGLAAELYDLAREDSESTDPATADEGDYLRYTIKPGTITINTGIDGKVGTDTSYTFLYSLEYYTSKEDEMQVDQKVASILGQLQQNGITAESSEYDRAKAVYDYLSETVHYNNQARPDNGNLMITAYDSLVREEAQCYGQLLGAYRLLKELGLPVRRVNGQAYIDLNNSGTPSWVNHGWNIVKIGDLWYNFDVTASASYFEGYGQSQLHTYRYLLTSEAELSGKYQRSEEYDSTTEFYTAHPMADTSYGYEPDAPEELTLTVSGETSVTAVYSEVSGAEGYILLRSESAEGPFSIVGESSSTECIDNTIEINKEYHYKVQSYKTVQGYTYFSAYSPRRIITVKEIGDLEGLKAAQSSYNSIQLEWSEAENALYYEIWRSTDKNNYTKVATLNADTLSYTNKSLLCGTTYYYKVRAYRFRDAERIYGNYSDVVSITPVLSAPGSVQVNANTYNSLKISWTEVDGANYYQVYRSTSKNGSYALLGVYDSSTFSSVSRSLGCGTTYYYKVRAYRWVNGNRVFSNYSNVVSGAPKLSAPQNVQANGNTYNTVKISWAAVDGANYYQVYRSNAANGSYVLLGVYDSNTLSSLSRSLGCGTTYYYKVRAYRWVGGNRIFSSFSSVTSAKPILSAPQNVKAVRTSSSTVGISWSKVDGANYYQVYRATSSNGKYALLGTYDSNTTSSVSKALKSGTKYYYKVRAYRWVGGERVFSSFSTISSATPY